MNIINTSSGTDYSSVRTVIFVNPLGYSVTDPTVKIVDTANGSDFSSLRPVILIDTDGNSL